MVRAALLASMHTMRFHRALQGQVRHVMLVQAVVQPTCAFTLIQNVVHPPLLCPLLSQKFVLEQGSQYATQLASSWSYLIRMCYRALC